MKHIWKMMGVACVCGLLLLTNSGNVQAAQAAPEVTHTSSYLVKIDAPSVPVYASANDRSQKQAEAARGEVYEVLGQTSSGWAKIQTGDTTGFIKVPGKAVLVEKTKETVDQTRKTRRELVEFALQFVGGSYQYGGADPNTGVDCSGFTRYIMKRAAGIVIPHSSVGQALCGNEVTVENMSPGDLIFYGASSGSINHVAMYIGDGMVVHASTESTGIKTSPYNYRTPVKVVTLF